MKPLNIPPMVRILPMDSVLEFENEDLRDVQSGFFLDYLPGQKKGKYLHKQRGLDADKGTIVLFQYDSQIIALAKYIKDESILRPVGNDHYGAYYFDPDSIEIFDPISNKEIKTIWKKDFVDSNGVRRSGFKRFSQTKWFLNPAEYPKFLKLLKNKNPIAYNSHPKYRKYGAGGESQAHKDLKDWLANNPAKLGLTNVVDTETEYRFLSNDLADIVFIHMGGEYTVVEVETNYPLPGAHQAIKYRALLCAEKQLPLNTNKVKAILVAWVASKEVRAFCRTYQIEYQIHKL